MGRGLKGLECLEERTLLATVTVNTTGDVLDGDASSIAALLSTPGPDGVISLREAIQAANNTANVGSPDQICFAVPGGGVHTIRPTTAFPTITNPVVIDATTQAGYSGDPLIQLDGDNAGSGNGLRLTAGGSTVRGLAIGRFKGCGIRLENGGGNVIAASFIGIDASGTVARQNTIDGVCVVNSPNNTIGGTNPGARNVISGNADHGITICGSGSTGNLVVGNFIGTDKSGTVDLGNGGDGVILHTGAASNTVGGTAAGAANVISGNGHQGVVLYGSGTSSNVVRGNFIGTDPAGTAALGNADDGIHIADGASNNTIGGTAVAARNVISGNGSDGVELRAATTANNSIVGNYIGTDATGRIALPNGNDGIEIEGATGNTIGGTQPGAGNVISGNTSDGIETHLNAFGNAIQGNRIGVAKDGAGILGNGGRGIVLGAGASGYIIGGIEASAANVIAYNGAEGIYLAPDAASGNCIRGNSVFYNTELGIDLGVSGSVPKGVTVNDSTDPDTGANGLQNFPVLLSAVTDGTSLQINGSLNSTPQTAFTIDFYVSAPPLGVSDGQTWIGSVIATTGATGDVSLHASMAASVPAGHVLTATATAPDGSTSEFSLGVQIVPADGTPLVTIRDAGVIEGDSGTKDAVFTTLLAHSDRVLSVSNWC